VYINGNYNKIPYTENTEIITIRSSLFISGTCLPKDFCSLDLVHDG